MKQKAALPPPDKRPRMVHGGLGFFNHPVISGLLYIAGFVFITLLLIATLD